MSTSNKVEALIDRIIETHPEMEDRIPEIIYLTYITEDYPGLYSSDPTEPINIEALNDELDAKRSYFEESYAGEYDSLSDFATHYVEEIDIMPDELYRYLDAQNYWYQELRHYYTYFEYEGMTYIFRDL